MEEFKSSLTKLIREADPTYIIGKVILLNNFLSCVKKHYL